MILEMFDDLIATGVTRVFCMAAVLRCGKQMEKTTLVLLLLENLYPKLNSNWKNLRKEEDTGN